MKLLLSSDGFEALLFGNTESRQKVFAAIETLTKKNHIFVLPLNTIDYVLSREPDPLKREILWNQAKNLFVDFLPLRKEEIALALRLSAANSSLTWEKWTQVAIASLADLDGILCLEETWKGQSLVRTLFAQEVDFGGLA